MKVYIQIRDKETGLKSKRVSLEDVIYKQNEIEFEFSDDTSLPYKDFLFWSNDYEVICKVKE